MNNTGFKTQIEHWVKQVRTARKASEINCFRCECPEDFFIITKGYPAHYEYQCGGVPVARMKIGHYSVKVCKRHLREISNIIGKETRRK